jgi:hypothetical protein
MELLGHYQVSVLNYSAEDITEEVAQEYGKPLKTG